MTRQSIVDGQFYESDSDKLNNQIESCFKNRFGPGSLPSKTRDKNIIGVVCPHAGYAFSGPCQAFSYKEIGESKLPDVYILFGLSHSGFNSCISTKDWETPFGIVKTDKELGEKLSEMSGLPIDEVAHQNEHSIEVQLPFLQFVNKNNDFKILPIIISYDADLKKIAQYIKETLDQTKKTCILIASSDFTHYGLNYGFVPFSDNIKENMYKLDQGAIDFIEKLNSDKFLDYTEEKQATICGKHPIAALIETSKLLGAKKAELLKYYTSGDILKDYNSAVGYASIIIK
ncbi:AmmeMemoRadiSam system protein B [Candidatus Woesearchaeota archaeon B3_Woes]|nr:MAG: AmmeMemoRadiSam system protein B [Candidatus Woesearchaeota archaeon B3_Woes]